MADDKSNAGARDRARVAGEERYELDYFANKHGLTKQEAQSLIDRHGNSRATLDKAAADLKSKR